MSGGGDDGKATEILEEGGTAWRRVGDLPTIGNSLIGARKGATLGNKVYLIGKMKNITDLHQWFFTQLWYLGGWNVSQYFNTVFKFDPETESWTQEEQSLLQARAGPGVSVVRYDNLKQYCQAWEHCVPCKYCKWYTILI